MLGRVLLAALLWLSVWMATGRVVTMDVAEAGPARAAAAACQADVPAGSTETGDRRWDVPHQSGAPAIESVWRSQLLHAELAGVPCLQQFDTARREVTPPRSAPAASPYLRTIPLLI